MNEKILPLGSVVRLTNGTKKIMIEGYHMKANDENKIYTYCGVIWPEGHMENKFCLFNPYQIEEVYFRGLENEETNKYAEKMNSILSGNDSSHNLTSSKTKKEEEKHRGRVKKAPNQPKSKSEMKQIYGIEKTSAENFVNMRKN